ncbi:hypothetical protein ES703_100910 [subsurface metagenome]
MATIIELLEALNTKEAAVSTGDLASDLKASKEGTLKQLTREKEKGNVDGNSQEGWLITDAGRKALEGGDIRPSMLDEGVTPRQQFEAIGRRIGIKEDRIVLATDIVWSGEYNDVKWAWEALGQANIADDLRSVWVNAWRAKLHKAIPPELETELTGVSKAVVEAEGGAAPSKPGGRDYIIIEDEPVRVGENLGDYSLGDAKEILGFRALKSRFAGISQTGAAQPPGAVEKVSDLITALGPYINKGSDVDTLKEILADKLALQRQEILSQLPHPGQPSQPKSWIEQLTEAVAALGSLKDAGPMIRAIFGIPESPSGNPSTGTPVQLTGPDGQPMTMDLGQVIDWKKFQGEERRADERQTAITETLKVARENIPDGIQAILKTAEEAKRGTGAKSSTPEPQQQTFQCGDCQTQFSPPAGWVGQPLKCPNPECGREYTKEELLA